jgi:hypothetical protein
MENGLSNQEGIDISTGNLGNCFDVVEQTIGCNKNRLPQSLIKLNFRKSLISEDGIAKLFTGVL